MRTSRSTDTSGKERNSRQIEYWPIAKLYPGPKVRKHPEAQIERIRASIQKFGFQCPPLIADSGEIIAGAARVEAARRLGFDEVPVLVATGLSAADIKAYRIADNKLAEMSSWDRDVLKFELGEILEIDDTFDLQYTGFDTAEIDLVLNPGSAEEVGADDLAPALPANAVSRVGDVWVVGPHRVICSDALKPGTYIALMQGAEARLCITDPPWNVAVNGHVGGLGRLKHREFVQASGEMTDDEFGTFLSQAIAQIRANVCDGGMAALFIDWRGVERMLTAGRTLDLSLQNICVWNKSNAGMGSLYRSKHELICLFKRGKAKHVNNVQLGAKGRYRVNVFDYAGVNSFGAGRMEQLEAHPTVKPVAMIADIIMDLTHRGDVVLDSFLGSGTTMIAAQKTGRVARCIELDPLYVDVALRRFRSRFGVEAIHEATGQTFDAIATERGNDVAAAPADLDPPVRARTRPLNSVQL